MRALPYKNIGLDNVSIPLLFKTKISKPIFCLLWKIGSSFRIYGKAVTDKLP